MALWNSPKPALVDITKEMIENMKSKASKEFISNRPTSTESKGRVWGFLGEEILNGFLPDAKLKSTSNYDLVYKGKTIDVKTKCRPYLPALHFQGAIDACMSFQKPDFYVFINIDAPTELWRKDVNTVLKHPFKRAWIMGIIEREWFYDLADFHRKGSVDNNGLKYRQDVYTIQYGQLRDIHLLKG